MQIVIDIPKEQYIALVGKTIEERTIQGKREYVDLVSDIMMCEDDVTHVPYVSVNFLNLKTCMYESKSWRADMVRSISSKIVEG